MAFPNLMTGAKTLQSIFNTIQAIATAREANCTGSYHEAFPDRCR